MLRMYFWITLVLAVVLASPKVALSDDRNFQILPENSQIKIKIGNTAGGLYQSHGPKEPGITGKLSSDASLDKGKLNLSIKKLEAEIHTASGRSMAKEKEQREKDNLEASKFARWIPKMSFSLDPLSIKGNKIEGDGAYAFSPFPSSGTLTMGPIFSEKIDLQTAIVRDNDGIYMVFKGRLDGKKLPFGAKLALQRFGKDKSIEIEGRFLIGSLKNGKPDLKQFKNYENKFLNIESLKFPEPKRDTTPNRPGSKQHDD